MPVQVSYPGVYIDEVPSTVRTIIGVPTAVAAFVGPAARGPVDEPRHITSWSDFDRIYGGLSSDSLMSYAVSHYYGNGGSAAEIVRVAARPRAARIDLGGGAGVVLEAKAPGAAGNDIIVRVDHDPADATVYRLNVKGDAAPFTIKVDAKKGDPGSLEKELAQSKVVQAAKDTKRGKPPASPPPAGTDPFADPALPKGKGGDDGATRSRIALPTGKKANGQDVIVTLEARDPGSWGINLRALVDYDTLDPGTLYNLTVQDTDPVRGSEEIWRNVSTDSASPNRLDRVLTDSRLVRARKDTPLDVRPSASVKDENGKPVPVPATGGADGPPVTEDEVKGTDGVTKSGIYALRSTDIFTMLCVPPLTRESQFAGDLMSAAAGLCLDRRAMLLVDAPHRWTNVDIAVDRAGAITPTGGVDEARNAAVYFPWVRLPDENGRLEDFPPSGLVAGVWARTDGQRNVAKAPAGTETGLSGVQELQVKMTDAENGRLNPLGINCLRTFPALGPVVWGARTRKGDDRLTNEWKYVPVRRTALFIEETLYRGTKWVVFEPNDEPLWAAIRLNVGAFMNTLFRQGMFQGRTPQQAYLVKCDAENNPQNDIDRGIVNILVGFAPLKPAEFVLVHIQQLSPAPQV
jgi:phage tail sheath protein FI